MILDASTIVSELASLKFSSIESPRDERIFCPSDEWLPKFAKWFLALPKPRARLQSFDCDDFALRAVDRATDALNDAGLPEDCGHSFGFAKVTIPAWDADMKPSTGLLGIPPSDGTHILNIVRTSSGWKFFEPQTGQYEDAKTLIARRAVAARLWAWV